MANNAKKTSRRTVALLWLLGVAVVIGIIIYLEQIAVLYLLATISLVILLLIVAFSDLEDVEVDGRDGSAPNTN